MIRDVSAEEFEKMSYTAKKRYISKLLIRAAKATPVEDGVPPVAIVMAGIPGAGKTEFLDSLEEEMIKLGRLSPFVRVDLDQIVTVYPDYTPKTYAQFRDRANGVLAHSIDELRHGRYNMMIDGTFSGASGSSVRNIEKLLQAGFIVSMFYMYDEATTAWRYTQLREIETDRGIDKEGFLQSCENISRNLQMAVQKFKSDNKFTLAVVKQKELRDKNYAVIMEDSAVDEIINQGYNIDNLRKIL